MPDAVSVAASLPRFLGNNRASDAGAERGLDRESLAEVLPER
jgi:hypothetical protein